VPIKRQRLKLKYQLKFLVVKYEREFENSSRSFYFGGKMKVKLTYHDQESFTIDEVIRQAKQNYGSGVEVEILPESTTTPDILYFALQQMIVHKQLSALYDAKSAYHQEIKKLREETLYKVQEVLDEVIMDNEAKAS
jgi:hypothetical protein